MAALAGPTPNRPPTVSLTSPISGASSTAPASVTLSANASDSDGSIAKVEFYNGTTLINTDTTAPYRYDGTGVAADSYTLTAKATDNLGVVTTSAPVSITVSPPPNVAPTVSPPPNVAPTVSMTGPADGSSYTAPANITLSANAADSDGSITAVEVYNGATLIGSVTTPPYATTWSNVPLGNYSVRARAVDNQGAATYSNTIAVNVNAVVASGVYYLYADHLNTPRMITDTSNKVVWRWDSDPFGADAANEDPDGDGTKFRYNPRFPGQYFDRETGLHYNYFRDYEPGTGRYVQSDPIGLEGGLNTYAYVGGNPVSYTDPFGLLFGGTTISAGMRGISTGTAIDVGFGSVKGSILDGGCYAKCKTQEALTVGTCGSSGASIVGSVGGIIFWAAGLRIGATIGGEIGALACGEALDFKCEEKCKKCDFP
ncbi:MAG: Ig-like domain-containing protein [Thiobacillus sp.]